MELRKAAIVEALEALVQVSLEAVWTLLRGSDESSLSTLVEDGPSTDFETAYAKLRQWALLSTSSAPLAVIERALRFRAFATAFQQTRKLLTDTKVCPRCITYFVDVDVDIALRSAGV